MLRAENNPTHSYLAYAVFKYFMVKQWLDIHQQTLGSGHNHELLYFSLDFSPV